MHTLAKGPALFNLAHVILSARSHCDDGCCSSCSGAYFINLLWNYASTPGLWAAASFLNCTLIHDAVALMLDTWATEQHHEEQSPYRYAELPREGRGPKSGYTGAANRGAAQMGTPWRATHWGLLGSAFLVWGTGERPVGTAACSKAPAGRMHRTAPPAHCPACLTASRHSVC